MKKITSLTFYFFFVLVLNSYAQAPSNDDCFGAITLSVNLDGNCINDVLTFNGNETDSNNGTPSCAPYTNKDLWYKFVMPSDGAVRIKASKNTNIDDLAIQVFSGDCNNLTEVGCDDDGNPDPFPDDLFPQIEVTEAPNSTVYFRIWDLDNVGPGTVNVCLSKIDPPLMATNDECSTPSDLSLNSSCSNTLSTNFGATQSSEANPSCAVVEGADVWYKVTVPNDKSYDISIETSEDSGSSVFDTAVAIYSGTCGTLFEEACDDDSGTNLFSQVELINRTNEILYVRVYPVQLGQTGTFNICAVATETLSNSKISFNEFNMYPNPARDIVNLKFGQTNKTMDINIYDLQGKLVLQTLNNTIQNNRLQLNISSLKTGMYFVKINDKQNSLTQKLIVR